MKILNWLRITWFRLRTKVEKYPVFSKDINKFLKNKFPNSYIECLDATYLTCDYETIKKIAPIVPVRFWRKYELERSDCDDFGRGFWYIVKIFFPRLPLGYCHVVKANGVKHALCFIIYVTKRGSLRFSFIESQTGQVSHFNYKPYLMLV